MFTVGPFQGFLRRSGEEYEEMLRELPAQYAKRGSHAMDDVSGRAIDAVIAAPSRFRGFMAIALDEPRVYRGIIAHAGEPTLPFTAGETTGPNVQGLLTHLAGAVEHGAPPEAVLPAVGDLTDHYIHLQQAKLVDSSALFWSGFVVHHRLGGRPLATFADWLHAMLYRAAGEEP